MSELLAALVLITIGFLACITLVSVALILITLFAQYWVRNQMKNSLEDPDDVVKRIEQTLDE